MVTAPTGMGQVFSSPHPLHWAGTGLPPYLTPSHMLEFTTSPWGSWPRTLFLGKASLLLSPNSSLYIFFSPDYPTCLLSCQAPSLNFVPVEALLRLCLSSKPHLLPGGPLCLCSFHLQPPAPHCPALNLSESPSRLPTALTASPALPACVPAGNNQL